MKLVELLAKEMDKWPEDCNCGYCMQANETTEVFFGGPAKSVFLSELADDRVNAKVTTAQWQAERDRQKGGEWRRHRGGRQPVADDVLVEVRHRDGEFMQWRAREQEWSHVVGGGDIMQYRIISQPQAEENTFAEAVHKPIIEALNTMAAEWHTDQIDGPLKWRDCVIHCQAIIEDCEREIAKNENLLAIEGFSLIPAMTPVAGVADIDMSDWRNWKVGDTVIVGGNFGSYGSDHFEDGAKVTSIDLDDSECPVEINGLLFTATEIPLDVIHP